MGQKREKQEGELKKYIIVIDYARFDNIKLYGAGAIEEKDINLLLPLKEKFPYVGKLRSQQKKQLVSDFPHKIRRVEKYLDLVASTDMQKVFDSIEVYVKNSVEVVVDPVAYGGFAARFPSVVAEKEDKNRIRRAGRHAMETLLNITDVFIRWVRNTAGRENYVFARLHHGRRRIKVK